jgi:hypothetical protein
MSLLFDDVNGGLLGARGATRSADVVRDLIGFGV